MRKDLLKLKISETRERIRDSRAGVAFTTTINLLSPFFDWLRTLNRSVRPNKELKIGSFQTVVFIHIPKTAGTLLNEELKDKFRMIKIHRPVLYKNFNQRGHVSPEHVLWQELVNNGYVSKEYSDNAFKFTVVRDPYRRFVSAFNFMSTLKFTKASTLRDFLDEVESELDPPFQRFTPHAASPQTTWLLDEHGKMIVDKIYRMENLAELQLDFQDRFGVDLDLSRTVNKSKGKASLEDLMQDEELLKRFNRVYESDFRLLGYKMISHE